MTSICSSQERIAAPSSQDVAAAPADTLFTVGALALGSAAVVAAGLGQAAAATADHGVSLATPAILALVSAAMVVFSRTLPDRGAVLSAAAVLAAGGVIFALFGANAEVTTLGRLFGGFGLGAVVAIAAERAVSLVTSPKPHTAGILSTGIGTGVVLGLSAGAAMIGL